MNYPTDFNMFNKKYAEHPFRADWIRERFKEYIKAKKTIYCNGCEQPMESILMVGSLERFKCFSCNQYKEVKE